MDENDPLFTRYCHALYALHCSLRDAAAGRERESPTYATTLGERRRVREALADLADAMNARGMSAAQFVGSVRALAWEVLGPSDANPLRSLQSPAVALFLFDAGLEYAAAVALDRSPRGSTRTTS